MAWNDRLYLGTWQFGGQFKKLSFLEIENLLSFAVNSGIRRFDTAAVYGNGDVERILGQVLPKDSIIVTKIPARTKPSSNDAPIKEYYSKDGIFQGVEKSLERINRSSVDILLLHNWLPSWTSEAIEVLEALSELKTKKMARQVGISLPNGFCYHVADIVLDYLDVIEVPFNPQEKWILSQLPELIHLEKEILLRSLFCQGKILENQNTADLFLHKALEFGTSVVVGMTTENQIIENIRSMKKSCQDAL